MRYRSILYVTHHLIRYSGNAHEYFRERAERFFVLSINPTFQPGPSVLDEYRDGKLVATRTYHWYKGRIMPLHYVFFYLYYLHALCRRIPRATTVITFHPLFCVGSGFFRLTKNCRTIFWVFDFFARFDGWYGLYNRMADFYVRSLPDVLFLSEPMRIEYLNRVGPWREGTRRDVVELSILQKNFARAPEEGLLGFVGNLKEGQGVELAFDALTRDGSLRLEVVGAGTEWEKLKALAATLGVDDRVRWRGAITDDDALATISSRWEAGLALYDKGEYLAYADPGKVKLYWQLGLPVIMTDMSHIAATAKKALAAAVIAPEAEAVSSALRNIRVHRASFEKGVEEMCRRYETVSYLDAAFGRYRDSSLPELQSRSASARTTEPQPFVTVVVPTYNRKDKLRRLLASIDSSAYPKRLREVIVVDNASTDGTSEMIAKDFPDVQVKRQTVNRYSAAARNIGAEAARGEYVFFIDDDNILHPECISRLVAAMEADAHIGVAAPLMVHWDRPDIIWCAGGMISRWGLLSHLHGGESVKAISLPALLAADFFPNAYMVRADIFKKGMTHDAVGFPHNWNEPEFCVRVRQAGYLLFTVTAAVTHHDIDYSGPLTRIGVEKTYDQARARVLFRRKHLSGRVQWLGFFLVVLPVSSLVYLKAFATQKNEPFAALCKAYVSGTIAGFKGKA